MCDALATPLLMSHNEPRYMSMFANNVLLGAVVRVKVWIREQRMIKGTTRPLMANLDITPNQKNHSERQSEEASLCINDIVFLLCGILSNYEIICIAATGEKLAC